MNQDRTRSVGVFGGRRRRQKMDPQSPISPGILDEATAWVVRLSEPDAQSEDQWLAFEAWLRADAAHGPAYDAALAAWLAYDTHGHDLVRMTDVRPTPRGALHGRRPAALAAALAACLAVAVGGTVWINASSAPVQVYETKRGERRTVQLEDGSRLALNGASQVTVRFRRGERAVTMGDGEISFDVAHDASRPFTIAVADRAIRVVGTQFNVRRDHGQLSVTVRRGLVRVEAPAERAVALAAGSQLVVAPDGRQSLQRLANVDDVFAWQSGRLIYRDQPLAMVVSDLSRYFDTPVRLEGQAARSLRFSGVLTTGTQRDVVARLCDLLSLTASEADGAIVLKAREPAR